MKTLNKLLVFEKITNDTNPWEWILAQRLIRKLGDNGYTRNYAKQLMKDVEPINQKQHYLNKKHTKCCSYRNLITNPLNYPK